VLDFKNSERKLRALLPPCLKFVNFGGKGGREEVGWQLDGLKVIQSTMAEILEDRFVEWCLYSRNIPNIDKEKKESNIHGMKGHVFIHLCKVLLSSPPHLLCQGYPHPASCTTVCDHKDTILVSAL
jgi:hypothetical protein